MATLTTDLSAAQTLGLAQAGKIASDGTLATGDVKIATAMLTVAATDATGDTLNICRLPKGVRVVPELCSINSDDAGTAYPLTVGDSGDVDRYSKEIAAGTAGVTAFLTPVVTSYKTTASGWVTATLGTVDTPTAGALVKFTIAYVGIS